MGRLLRQIWTWLLVFIEQPKVPVRLRVLRRSRSDLRQEHYGTFYFREKILDHLDAYFDVLKRMRKADAGAYHLYRQLGAGIMPEWMAERAWLDAPDTADLSKWWLSTRPTFGAVFLDLKSAEKSAKGGEKHSPQMLYFTKFKSRKAPTNFERRNSGDIYEVVIYFDHKRYGGAPLHFGVHVAEDGSVNLLRMLIRSKQGRRLDIPSKKWGMHPFYKQWATECKFADPERFLLSFFLMCANLHERANSSMIRVDVQKENCHAVFAVDVTRTPYFFKDRELVVSESGRRLRIFHIVRPHTRRGRVVRMHFRGERKFQWNGYDVAVSVPGYHHRDVTTFDVAGVYTEDQIPEGQISQKETATWLRRRILEHPIQPPNLH